MIVVKLMGGLGNQLFQYAYAHSLAKEYGEEILFDTSFYPSGRELALYRFHVPRHRNWEDVIPLEERKAVIAAQKRYRVLQKAKRVLLRTEELGEAWFNKNISKGYYFNFDPYFYPFLRTEKENKYLYGYFQSEKYFADCADSMQTLFKLAVPLSQRAAQYQSQIRSVNSVALHIRLGDYKQLKNYYLNVCTPEYYQQGIARMQQQLEDPVFFVFTNDADGARRLLDLPENSVIVEGTQDFEDFELIRSCEHTILSNSSFSWWAAYLNQNPKKMIIAPSPWFRTLKREADIYLPEMVKIPING